MSNRILVLSPHPDDEAIGVGGTIRMHIERDDVVHVVYVTSGEQGCPGEDPAIVGPMREEEAGRCSQGLQTHQLTFLHEPDGGVATMQHRLRAKLAKILGEWKPDIIYTPTHLDEHTDHVATTEALREVWAGQGVVREYEVWTPLPRFNVKHDITPWANYKWGAIKAHTSQAMRNPFAEAVMSLNHWRGLLHGPNQMYVEVFYQWGLDASGGGR